MNTDFILPFAIDVLLKSLFVTMLGFLVFYVWRGASASQRDLVWCVVFAILLTLPLTRLAAPHWIFSWPTSAGAESGHHLPLGTATVAVPEGDSVEVPKSAESWSLPDLTTVVIWGWIGGGVLLFAYRLGGSFMICRCQRRSVRLPEGENQALISTIATSFRLSRSVEVRLSEDCPMPVTWGTWRPVVMLPYGALQWPVDWLEAALRHEMGHVKRFDHLKRWLSFLACAFYWPNPLVWVAAKRFQVAQEEASDDLVLRGGIAPQDYAAQLIEVIRIVADARALTLPVVAMARRSTVEGRIMAILDETRNRGGSGRRMIITGIGLAVVFGVGLGAAQVRAEDGPSPVIATPAAPHLSEAEALQAKLINKVNTLVLTQPDLKQVTVGDALQAIERETVKGDPEHQGVNFVLKSPGPTRKIDLKLNQVLLKDVLDSIANQTNLHYSIEAYAVYFRPAVDGDEVLTVRTFLVPDALIPLLKIKPGTTGDVSRTFANLGILLPKGASFTYLPEQKKLVGKDTPKQLDLVNDLFARMSSPPSAGPK